MYPTTCPKCAAVRARTSTGPEPACVRCGLVFAKWIAAQSGLSLQPGGADAQAGALPGGRPGPVGALLARLAQPPASMGRTACIGHGVLLAVLFVWSWTFILGDVRSGASWNGFMHGVNLVFHEAGHVLMMPFGQFMHVLGGTVGQLAMPMAACIALIVTRNDTVGASVALWWFGQSLTDCAPYIADARKLELPLLGGGTGAEREGHDWEYLLNTLGLAEHDILLGNLARLAGGVTMLLAVAWGGWMLWQAAQARGTRE
jgi:hypothetical protein